MSVSWEDERKALISVFNEKLKAKDERIFYWQCELSQSSKRNNELCEQIKELNRLLEEKNEKLILLQNELDQK